MPYHTLAIGSPKTGKTTLLINRTLQAINSGDGVFFLDPTGFTIPEIIRRTHPKRAADVILIDPTATDPTPLNLLYNVPDKHRPLTAHTLRDILKDNAKYGGFGSNVFDRLIYYTALTALDLPNASIPMMKEILLEAEYREKLIKNTKRVATKAFWLREYGKWNDRSKEDRIQSSLAQLDVFLLDPRLSASFCYPKSSIDLSDTSDKIILASVPVRSLGSSAARAAGLMLLGAIHSPTTFIEDCGLFYGEVLNSLYDRTSLTVSTNTTGELKDSTDTILNSSGEKIVFRLGGEDVELLNRLLKLPRDTVSKVSTANTKSFHAYISSPDHDAYNAEELPDVKQYPFKGVPNEIKKNQKRYTVKRQIVEKAIDQVTEQNL